MRIRLGSLDSHISSTLMGALMKTSSCHDTGGMHSQDFRNSAPVLSLAKGLLQAKNENTHRRSLGCLGNLVRAREYHPRSPCCRRTADTLTQYSARYGARYGYYLRRVCRGPTEIEVGRVNAKCPPPEGESHSERGVAWVGVEASGVTENVVTIRKRATHLDRTAALAWNLGSASELWRT